MELVKKAEKTLGDLYKGAPKLADKTKESLVSIWPWLALIFGVLQLFAALTLFNLVRDVNRISTVFGVYTGSVSVYSGTDKLFMYLGLAMLVVDAVIMLLAYPKLVKRQKSGWDLMFIGSLLNVLYAVVNLFIRGRGVGDFLVSLIGSAVGFYLLFQVREKFKA